MWMTSKKCTQVVIFNLECLLVRWLQLVALFIVLARKWCVKSLLHRSWNFKKLLDLFVIERTQAFLLQKSDAKVVCQLFELIQAFSDLS